MNTTVVIPFDTLAFVRELENAGVPSVQAEAHTKALSGVIQHLEESKFKELATKGDIEAVKTELKRDIKELELRMVIKLGAMFLAAFGILRLWPIPVQYVPPVPTAQEMRLSAPPSVTSPSR